MGLGRSRISSAPYPFGLGLVGVVDEARYVTNQEFPVTLKESRCRDAALASVLKGSEDEYWKKEQREPRL